MTLADDISAMNEALKLEPMDAQTWRVLADAYEEDGDGELARDCRLRAGFIDAGEVTLGEQGRRMVARICATFGPDSEPRKARVIPADELPWETVAPPVTRPDIWRVFVVDDMTHSGGLPLTFSDGISRKAHEPTKVWPWVVIVERLIIRGLELTRASPAGADVAPAYLTHNQ